MKRIYSVIFVLLLLLPVILKAQYSSQNVSLIGHWYNPAQVAEPVYGIKYNSVWGWVDSTHGNKEYAILGSGSGTHIIDISTPWNPVEADFVPGFRTQCIWREYKTYKHYLYAISDDPVPNSFQIIDLSYLPDSVHVVYDGNTIFERAHTLYVDGDKLYIGSVKEHSPTPGGIYSMAVYSLANPELPTLLRTLNADDPSITWVHDMLVRNDTVYASCGYQGLFIYKYNTAANNFTTINTLTSYTDQGYNHSSALTPDGKTLVFCDEVPANKTFKVLDISDITNIDLVDTVRSNYGASPHNPYIRGADRVVIAYYQDGLQIFDISNPSATTRTGFFDTDTLHGLNDNYVSQEYHGAWGAYVDLPSGLILVGDMQNGLYILNASLALGIQENSMANNSVSVYPNPSSTTASVALNLVHSDELLFEIFDITGRKIMNKTESVSAGNTVRSIALNHFSSGIYILKITGKEINYSQKIVKE